MAIAEIPFRGPHGHVSDRITRAHATETVLLERIAELIRFRAWYRRQARQDFWWDLARRNDVELRGLLAVARRARRLADAAPDPMTLAKGDHYAGMRG